MDISQRIKWDSHKGQQILTVDFSNLKGDDLNDATEAYGETLLKCPPGPVLLLLDFRDAVLNIKSSKIAKNVESKAKDKGIVLTAACLGIGGITKTIVTAVKRDLHMGKDPEESKDWLVEQANK